MADLLCSICIYLPGLHVPGNDHTPAQTVINGHAVCGDHIGYVANGGSHQQALTAVFEHHHSKTNSAM